MVGILYESNEWSDWKLHSEMEAALEEPVVMIDMESEDAIEKARECEILISRVFASASFRGHERSLENMDELVDGIVGDMPTPDSSTPLMINPPRAHRFEISKRAATDELARAGLDVPRIQAFGEPLQLIEDSKNWQYPCIIKPDRGGRTTHTALLCSVGDAQRFLESAPSIEFVVEDFIKSREGFITRVEIVDVKIALIVKRSVEKSGLSSYHEGSTYEPYPDYPDTVEQAVIEAAALLDILYGSFDIIEGDDGGAYIIDANSVSNVSEDCTELLGIDLMKEHAIGMAARIKAMRQGKEPQC